MYHHGDVDIVEMALGDELGLAQHELDFAPRDAPRPLLDIDELFGRDGEKDDLAREVLGDLGIPQTYRRAQNAGDLGVVAAAVSRAGDRVGERMLGGAQTVELADEGEPRPRRTTGDPALDAGQSQTGLRRQPQGTHPLGDESGGFHLVEAGLRIAQDRLAETDDRIRMTVDGLADLAFQFSLAGHWILRTFLIRTASID